MMIKGGIRIAALWFLVQGGLVCLGQEGSGSNDYQYALIEAVKQKNLGNPAEAVKLYRLVIKDKPDCDVAYYELGTIYLMANQLDLARESLEKAFQLDRDNQWYTLAYLNALGAGEEFSAMVDILREKIKKDPDEAEWEFQLATVYYGMGRTKGALKILDRMERERGFSEKITLQKASIYENEEKFDLARMEIEKVMNLFPETLQFRIVAAELCLKSGKEELAAEYYEEILEMDSTNIFALTNLTDYYRKKEDYERSFTYLVRSFDNDMIDVKRKKAILSYYLTENKYVVNYKESLDKLVRVFLKSHPDDPEGLLLATDFYIDTRDYGEAYQHLNHYLETNRGSYAMYMQAILLANAASLNEEMLGIAEKAMELFPDSTDIRFFRGIGLYEKGEYSRLIENFENIPFDGFSSKEYASQSKMLYAEAFYRLKDYTTSDSIYESLIAEDPGNDVALNNYSFYLAERGEKLFKAKAWSKKTITNNPESATFLDTYAWILFKLESYEEAEKYIMDALEKGGDNDPDINEHAGDIQAAIGSYEIAKSYYQKAIILGGDKIKLDKKLGTLQERLDE